MPIKPENRKRYPKTWKLISSYRRRVVARNRCERCDIENGTLNERGSRVVLTVAHLNDTPEDNRPENLAALCQRCHLLYDMKIHVSNRRQTLRDRKGLQEIFPIAEIQKTPYRNLNQ